MAWVAIAAGVASAVVIAVDLLAGHRQHMGVMNVVWPVTGLYAGPLAVWAYYRYGRLSSEPVMMEAKAHGEPPPGKQKPFPAVVALAATHCGSGCTLGDLVAEWGVFFFPALLAAFGYGELFRHKMFATWVFDFIVAFVFGVAFQYFTIAPMRHLSPGKGIVAALKADTFSLTAWQVGMYGWMAIATFLIFRHELRKTDPVFWLMMQVAMLAGFATSYPVNWWLVRSGMKERM